MSELVMILLMVFIFFISMNAIVYTSPRTNTHFVDNETFQVNKTKWINLNNTFIEENSEEIYFSNGAMANGATYRVDQEEGELYLKEEYGGEIGTNNTIEYNYKTHTKFKQVVTNITNPFMVAIMLFVVGGSAIWMGDFR